MVKRYVIVVSSPVADKHRLTAEILGGVNEVRSLVTGGSMLYSPSVGSAFGSFVFFLHFSNRM